MPVSKHASATTRRHKNASKIYQKQHDYGQSARHRAAADVGAAATADRRRADAVARAAAPASAEEAEVLVVAGGVLAALFAPSTRGPDSGGGAHRPPTGAQRRALRRRAQAGACGPAPAAVSARATPAPAPTKGLIGSPSVATKARALSRSSSGHDVSAHRGAEQGLQGSATAALPPTALTLRAFRRRSSGGSRRSGGLSLPSSAGSSFALGRSSSFDCALLWPIKGSGGGNAAADSSDGSTGGSGSFTAASAGSAAARTPSFSRTLSGSSTTTTSATTTTDRCARLGGSFTLVGGGSLGRSLSGLRRPSTASLYRSGSMALGSGEQQAPAVPAPSPPAACVVEPAAATIADSAAAAPGRGRTDGALLSPEAPQPASDGGDDCPAASRSDGADVTDASSGPCGAEGRAAWPPTGFLGKAAYSGGIVLSTGVVISTLAGVILGGAAGVIAVGGCRATAGWVRAAWLRAESGFYGPKYREMQAVLREAEAMDRQERQLLHGCM
ncbi:hypothetical protein MNEG_9854 [Monoraphidium neglectum]|uniref:Uncharacterized protein n=1 Tax=Monoraphidium neglectum TaxID=145388 RepID=A0A0D2JF30_9CHLO|nr:hypothetical protein MNEG_9854 [Monoraphidium neglectum]KIY98107.1 hypothetical protein MNEG_9854 [Monoraphidium neglectum]|eukprot:XP_013897127.1 hypothetical protein MNEG_9854 [Monoraphidium neglectum]